MVKIQPKCDAKHVKYRRDDTVQGERNLKLNKFPLIEDQGGNIQIPSREFFFSVNIEKLQQDDNFDKKTRTPKSGKVRYFHENLKVKNPRKYKLIDARSLRELYPHPFFD